MNKVENILRIMRAKFLADRKGIYKHGKEEGLKEAEMYWNWHYHSELMVLYMHR